MTARDIQRRLIYDLHRRNFVMWRVVLNTVKQAPVLHRCKIDPAVRQQALENCYYRYHNLFR